MLSVKREKILGLAFTVAAAVIYIALMILTIVYCQYSNIPLPIEGTTLMALQSLAFILLILGMVFHKENMILGTLVAALVASAVSYIVNDVTGILKAPIDFSLAWYYPASNITLFVAHGFLSCGTIAFLIFLISGRKAQNRNLVTEFFTPYVVLDVLGMIFLIVAWAADNSDGMGFANFFNAAEDFLAAFAFILDASAYFFHRKDGSLIEDSISRNARKAQRKERTAAVNSLDETIALYRKEVLKDTFEKKDGRLILTVDLTSVPFYEDCSKNTLLNSAIYSYVEDVAFALADGEELSLRFLFPEGTPEEEKTKVEKIFHAHYAIRYRDMREKITKTMIIAISFVFIGFLLMTLHLLYTAANSDSVYGEMLDVFGWVFAWEAIEMLCVNSFDTGVDLRHCRSLYMAPAVNETPVIEQAKALETK